jgi:tetratricopeptide (TPR) repeat protein
MGNLAGVIQLQGKPAEAEPLFREGLSINVARLGEDHVDTAMQRMVLGNCLTALGRFDEAERELLRAQSVFEEINLPDHALTALNAIAILYNRMGDYAQAIHIYERALKAQRAAGMRREQAVTLHGGEAQQSKVAFQNLSSTDKSRIIKFLESL